jgi:hypothetical protein
MAKAFKISFSVPGTSCSMLEERRADRPANWSQSALEILAADAAAPDLARNIREQITLALRQ